jgi:hypothetical protein
MIVSPKKKPLSLLTRAERNQREAWPMKPAAKEAKVVLSFS